MRGLPLHLIGIALLLGTLPNPLLPNTSKNRYPAVAHAPSLLRMVYLCGMANLPELGDSTFMGFLHFSKLPWHTFLLIERRGFAKFPHRSGLLLPMSTLPLPALPQQCFLHFLPNI